nr:hypothetical protein [uncultured Campylobacter sp.]
MQQHNHSARQGFSQFLVTYERTQPCAYDLFAKPTELSSCESRGLELKALYRAIKQNTNQQGA